MYGYDNFSLEEGNMNSAIRLSWWVTCPNGQQDFFKAWFSNPHPR